MSHESAFGGGRDPLLFAEHNRVDLAQRARDGAILVLPIGAIEQHGPHLPVWTDSLVAEHVAVSAARRVSDTVDLLVAPTLPYGSSDHHLPFGATLSLTTTTLLSVLMDLGRSAVESGFRRLFLFNGHGGNDELIQLAARDLSRLYPVHVAAGSWWHIARHRLGEEASSWAPCQVPGHAGAFESSVVQALRPDLLSPFPEARGPGVSTASKRDAPSRIELNGAWVRTDGFTDTPGALTDTEGSRILEIAVSALSDEFVRFDHLTHDTNDEPIVKAENS